MPSVVGEVHECAEDAVSKTLPMIVQIEAAARAVPADPGAGASGRPLQDARWTRMSWAVLTRRRGRVAGSVLLSVGVLALVLWQIDVGAAVDAIAEANGLLLLAALAVSLVATWGMAWRWQLLLTPRGLREPLGWLVRVYFVGYAAGQVLPTGLGGDALRIVEHARRRRGRTSEVTAAVVLERAIGMAGVLVMAAVGLGLAIGRYDGLGAIVVVEVVCVAIGAARSSSSSRGARGARFATPGRHSGGCASSTRSSISTKPCTCIATTRGRWRAHSR